MDTEWVRSFLLTAEQGSLSKASEALNLSQPALSKQIRRLEDACGVTLFHRSPLGVSLTEAGRLFRERVRPLFMELDTLLKELQTLEGPPDYLTMGVIGSVATHFLPRKLMGLRERNIRVQVDVGHTSSDVLDMLQAGRVDAALLEGACVPPFLWSTALFREPYRAVVPLSHRLARQSTLCLSDLQDEPLVVYPKTCDVRKRITEAYQERGWNPNISAEVPFGEFLLTFVAAGAGVTVVPKITADHLGTLPLVALPIEDLEAYRTIALAAGSVRVGKLLKANLA